MKMCKCTCGQSIDLRLKENVELELIDRGYDYPFHEYYAVCPYCGVRKKMDFNDFPLRTKWKLMRVSWSSY